MQIIINTRFREANQKSWTSRRSTRIGGSFRNPEECQQLVQGLSVNRSDTRACHAEYRAGRGGVNWRQRMQNATNMHCCRYPGARQNVRPLRDRQCIRFYPRVSRGAAPGYSLTTLRVEKTITRLRKRTKTPVREPARTPTQVNRILPP